MNARVQLGCFPRVPRAEPCALADGWPGPDSRTDVARATSADELADGHRATWLTPWLPTDVARQPVATGQAWPVPRRDARCGAIDAHNVCDICASICFPHSAVAAALSSFVRMTPGGTKVARPCAKLGPATLGPASGLGHWLSARPTAGAAAGLRCAARQPSSARCASQGPSRDRSWAPTRFGRMHRSVMHPVRIVRARSGLVRSGCGARTAPRSAVAHGSMHAVCGHPHA